MIPLVSSAPVVLDGIPLFLDDAAGYLRQLTTAFELHYPEFLPALGEPRHRPSPEERKNWQRHGPVVLGYCLPMHLTELLVRDWIDEPATDCGALVNCLTTNRLLDDVSSGYICGAGMARLADHLLAHGGFSRVTCVDLSWLVLHVGRLLLMGHAARIPPSLLTSRFTYQATADHRGIVSETTPLHLAAPRAADASNVGFEVRDCFGFEPVTADMVFACNFVESYGNRRAATLTLQILRQLGLGQRFLHVTWVNEKNDEGRSPEVILEILNVCGFEVDWLDFVKLPYTFNPRYVGGSRADYRNLVLRATKRRESDPGRIHVALDSRDRWIQEHAADVAIHGRVDWRHSGHLVMLNDIERHLIGLLAQETIALDRLSARLGATVNEAEAALTHLARRWLVNLRVD